MDNVILTGNRACCPEIRRSIFYITTLKTSTIKKEQAKETFSDDTIKRRNKMIQRKQESCDCVCVLNLNQERN